MNLIITCKKNYENILAGEMALSNIDAISSGLGYIFATSDLNFKT